MPRISLREMLLLVAAIAMAIVSLKYANDAWLRFIITILMATFVGGLIVAFVDRGARQAFAIGFVLAAASYGYLLETDFPYLPTSWVLRHLYTAAEHGRWIDSDTGKELPNFDPSKTPQRLRVVGNRGMPVDVWEERPPEAAFMRVGRAWFAMLFGYVGGIFACFVHGRRTREERKQQPETS